MCVWTADKQTSIFHRHLHHNRLAHTAPLVPSSKISPKTKFHRHHKTNTKKYTSQYLLLLILQTNIMTLYNYFYCTKRIKRIYFYNHSAVVVMCYLYPVFTLLTYTVIVIPLSYLPVSIHTIVGNSQVKGVPALCPTG